MTYEELLKSIEILIADFCEGEYCATCAPYKALRAVVQFHKPTDDPLTVNTFCLECRDEHWPAFYPCPTIQAIEKELR